MVDALLLCLPSGKRLHNDGKSPFFMGKSTISMAIFKSYVTNYQRVYIYIYTFICCCFKFMLGCFIVFTRLNLFSSFSSQETPEETSADLVEPHHAQGCSNVLLAKSYHMNIAGKKLPKVS